MCLCKFESLQPTVQVGAIAHHLVMQRAHVPALLAAQFIQQRVEAGYVVGGHGYSEPTHITDSRTFAVRVYDERLS